MFTTGTRSGAACCEGGGPPAIVLVLLFSERSLHLRWRMLFLARMSAALLSVALPRFYGLVLRGCFFTFFIPLGRRRQHCQCLWVVGAAGRTDLGVAPVADECPFNWP